MSARGQLHARLRGRDDIVSHRANRYPQARSGAPLPNRRISPPIDVSFISLKLVLPAVGNLLNAAGEILALIKPQFEAGRSDIKKGIVRDEAST